MNVTITSLMVLLMLLSLLTISSHSIEPMQTGEEIPFLTAQTWAQMKWFMIAIAVYLGVASIDYHRLREWTWPIYGISIAMLIGVFFTEPIANVHRWYRVPGLGMSLQPSEYSEVALVMALSWYIERCRGNCRDISSAMGCVIIALIPFTLIMKQPDLGSALVIFPMVMGIFYFADVYPPLRRWALRVGVVIFGFVLSIFLGLISHEALRPYALCFLREYQYERLNPGGYHNLAGQTAVALGNFFGRGWRQGVYSNQGWLPEPYTDSIFASMSEELGLVGALFVIGIYGGLAVQGFRVAASTKDLFGQLLAVGLTLYLAVHAIINIGVMVGLLPVTGVPLPLMSYGGSACLSSALALGLIQSIWTRRFTF